MKVKSIFGWVIVAAMLGVAAWVWAFKLQAMSGDAPDQERATHRVARWRANAAPLMLAQATNNLVGFNRLISARVDCEADNVKTWVGHVTAEYVNHQGGLDRTNLDYSFSAGYADDLLAILKSGP